MKSIFDKEIRNEVVSRINSLNENSNAQWGKMTVAQMVRHCSICEEYYYGKLKVKRSFLGRIFGKIAIAMILRDETTGFKKNSTTPPLFKVTESNLHLETEKDKWKQLIDKYETFPEDHFIHWFFGKMTRKQLGQFIYKHSDHHLRQFGAGSKTLEDFDKLYDGVGPVNYDWYQKEFLQLGLQLYPQLRLSLINKAIENYSAHGKHLNALALLKNLALETTNNWLKQMQ